MAVTIARTAWIDDDGSGTYGTVINNAEKTLLYNQIDAALAQVAALGGGNSFTGTQTINGLLTVLGFGRQTFSAGGTGSNILIIQNTLGGATNSASLQVGNNVDDGLLTIYTYASTFTPVIGYDRPNASAVVNRASGLAIVASAGGGIVTFHTGGTTERMRIDQNGSVLIGTTTALNLAKLGMAADLAGANLQVLQNSGGANSGDFLLFVNSANAACGTIAQTGATTIAYNTTSDARLKTDRGRVVDLSALRGVVVHDFTWTADGRRDRGVFAQETAPVFPRAVSKGTDERTDGGDLRSPWMTDYSKFVPDLIAGWQQHETTIAALRAELLALKGSRHE